jgi:hypothetical protein
VEERDDRDELVHVATQQLERTRALTVDDVERPLCVELQEPVARLRPPLLIHVSSLRVDEMPSGAFAFEELDPVRVSRRDDIDLVPRTDEAGGKVDRVLLHTAEPMRVSGYCNDAYPHTAG